jgi:DNA-nicking Smr family endonuclease
MQGPGELDHDSHGPADRIDYAAPGVDRREIRKLKRGEHTPAARCDLHGMTAPEAIAATRSFVAASRGERHRCVCIVHGRGIHSPANAPVLKIRIRELLRAEPGVLAYADAPAADGGSGAVYVLLRR